MNGDAIERRGSGVNEGDIVVEAEKNMRELDGQGETD